jgi:hypothetical protein
MQTVVFICVLFITFFVCAIFWCVQKGFNEVIKGLVAIHEELQKSNGKR